MEVISLVRSGFPGKERFEFVGARCQVLQKYDLSLSDRSLNPTRFGSRPEHGSVTIHDFAAESLSKAFARQKATYAFELDGGVRGWKEDNQMVLLCVVASKLIFWPMLCGLPA